MTRKESTTEFHTRRLFSFLFTKGDSSAYPSSWLERVMHVRGQQAICSVLRGACICQNRKKRAYQCNVEEAALFLLRVSINMRLLVLVAGKPTCWVHQPGLSRFQLTVPTEPCQVIIRRTPDSDPSTKETLYLSLHKRCLDSAEKWLVRWTPSVDGGRCDETQLAAFSRAANACNIVPIRVHPFPAGAFA